MRTRLADRAGLRRPVRDAVVSVEPRGEQQVGRFIADAADHLADQPRPVFETAAVRTRAVLRREQFRKQVAVALLEIDEVDADLRGQAGRGDVLILDPLEFVIREERIRIVDRPAGRLVDGERVEQGIVRGQQRPAVSVAARVGDLQADEQIGVAAAGVAMRLPAAGEHRFDRRGRSVVQPELPRIGSSLVADRGRFAPDQFRPAAAEADVAAVRQLVGPAVERAVAALHRLNGEAVAAALGADRHRLKQSLETIGECDRRTEADGFGGERLRRFELEITGHRAELCAKCGACIV